MLAPMLDPDTSAIYREALRAWRGRVVWQTLIASLVLIGLVAVGAGLALAGAIPLWAGAIATFIGIHAGFTILHEACHRAVSGDAPAMGWLDPMLGSIHAALLLYDFPTFRFLHLRHHAHTNDPALDPDYWMQRHRLPVVALLSLFVPLHYLRLYVTAASAGHVSHRDLVLALLRVGLLVAVLLTALVLAPLETFMLWLAPASVATALISTSHRMLHAAEISS